MNILDAAYNVVRDYPGGADALAPRLDKSGGALSAEVRRSAVERTRHEGKGGPKFGLVDAETVSILSGDLRILQTFAANCGQMVVPLPALEWLEGGDCHRQLAEAMKAMGALVQEVAADLADERLTDNELRRCEQRIGEVIQDLHRMSEALTQLNRRGKPQGAA